MRTYDQAVKAARKVKPAPTHETTKHDHLGNYACAESCGWFAHVDHDAPKSKVTVIIPGNARAAHSVKP